MERKRFAELAIEAADMHAHRRGIPARFRWSPPPEDSDDGHYVVLTADVGDQSWEVHADSNWGAIPPQYIGADLVDMILREWSRDGDRKGAVRNAWDRAIDGVAESFFNRHVRLPRPGEFDPWEETRGYVERERPRVEAPSLEIIGHCHAGLVRTETTEKTYETPAWYLDAVEPEVRHSAAIQPEPTVAEKWAAHISERIERVVYATGVADVMMEDGEWVEAREQLHVMRDEIDRALAEIEPLSVERGGCHE